MQTLYADLHVHIGRAADNKPVKIAASPRLTLDEIVVECSERKGIHIVGIIDAVCTPVYNDLRERCDRGVLTPRPGGGLSAADGRLTMFLGAELEVATGGKAAHYLSYFPDLEQLARFRALVKPHITNLSLSSQVVRVTPGELVEMTVECSGLFMLAHAFTPHKGYFGNCANALDAYFTRRQIAEIAAIELGLSADTSMADRVAELHALPYITNSDAHSLATIAREYTAFYLDEPSFDELKMALQGVDDRKIVANYGLDPRLGKYYRTFCPRCVEQAPLTEDRRCPECGTLVVRGVYDRLLEIADTASSAKRPPYIHQVPLQFIRGLGPAGMRRLLDRFGTQMSVLHEASHAELTSVVGERMASAIIAARSGNLAIEHGAGGRYGRAGV